MNRSFANSTRHMARARSAIPRGVSSAKRAAQLPTPLAFVEASGSHLRDVDGNDYVDYVAGFGPMLLGHAPEAIVAAVRRQLDQGILFGGQHDGELELAERIVRLVPAADRVSFFSSGSEAVHAALGMARGATGRRTIVKFEGHYHGWITPMAVNLPGSPPSEGGSISKPVGLPGWPASTDIIVCPWGDLGTLTRAVEGSEGSVAAIIMEAVACNAGTLLPPRGYLEGVRSLCDRHGIVLIFDEVITGFRLALGGAQELLGTVADIAVLGKALGAGFPISAVAATTAASECAATGPVEMRGTYNGHPVSVAAANAALGALEDGRDQIYPHLDALSTRLAHGLRDHARRVGAPVVVNQVGSALSVLWGTPNPARTYGDVVRAERALGARFGEALLRRGVHTIDGEKWYVSAAHTEADIDATIELAGDAFDDLARSAGNAIATPAGVT